MSFTPAGLSAAFCHFFSTFAGDMCTRWGCNPRSVHLHRKRLKRHVKLVEKTENGRGGRPDQSVDAVRQPAGRGLCTWIIEAGGPIGETPPPGGGSLWSERLCPPFSGLIHGPDYAYSNADHCASNCSLPPRDQVKTAGGRRRHLFISNGVSRV